ncbi:MAG: hypothetical protein RL328_287 [Acidobacteriota bacterium]|jgi:hypothetical protein
MPRLPVLFLLAGILCGQTLSKQQKIERILDLTNPESAVTEVVNQVDEMLKQIQPAPSPQQKARRQEALDKIAKLTKDRLRKVRPDLIKAYSETFTDEEIDGLLAFYQSPAGKASITKIPAVNARLGGIIQSELNAIGSEINKLAEDTLKK